MSPGSTHDPIDIDDAMDSFVRPGIMPAGALGAIGLVVWVVAATRATDPAPALRSYLLAHQVVFGMSVGGLGFLLIWQLTGGTWGYAIRRPLEAAALTIPLTGGLFLPIALGARDLYPWAPRETTLDGSMTVAIRGYLDPVAFQLRSCGLFVFWSALAILAAWVSGRRANEPPTTDRFRRLAVTGAGPGLILLSLSGTIAAVDWTMSLEAPWTSSIYGLVRMADWLLAAIALTTLVRVLPCAVRRIAHRFDDLGSLLLTSTMLWGYVSFSQFLIIWYGNLPEEASFYLERTAGAWAWFVPVLAFVHFAIPTASLIFGVVRRDLRPLAALAGLLLAMRIPYEAWLIVPGAPAGTDVLRPLDAVALIGLVGLWVAGFGVALISRPRAEQDRYEPYDHAEDDDPEGA